MFVEEKVPAGKMVGIDLEIAEGRIARIKITGDFFLHPEKTIENIEEALIGCSIDDVAETVSKVLSENKAQLIGVAPEDIENLVKKAV
jgi:lipoate-protein ligase A